MSVSTYREVSYLSVGGASVEDLTADWLERTVDGESDRRSGRSQRCCRAELRAGTENARGPAHPAMSHFLYLTPPNTHTHIHTPSAEKKVFRGRRTGLYPDSVYLEQPSFQSIVCVCLSVRFHRNKTRVGREKHNASSSSIERRELQSKSSMCCTAFVCELVYLCAYSTHVYIDKCSQNF